MTEPLKSIGSEILHRGLTVPSFVYGTAWKEERTSACVSAALEAGFRGIDTANQRKHYFEAGVGEALQRAYEQNKLTRQDLFLQTKFTFLAGQDQRLPYDPQTSFSNQVNQSFASSLEHLQTDYLDSYVLHGPATGSGLTSDDWEVWRAMEKLQKSGAVKQLGISNINQGQLEALLKEAEIKPAFVQNRCYARRQWDRAIREICLEEHILYQGFSLLTANTRELDHPQIKALTEKYACSWTQLVFRFALDVGMQPLTGTTNPMHMQADLNVFNWKMDDSDIALIEKIAF
jgi:diketogulonate reductase-like aldo/keto reductase